MTARHWICCTATALSLALAPAAQSQQPVDELLLSVDDVVRMALERSRDLQVAEHGLTEARKQVSEEWGSALPSVNASASYVRNISPAVSFVPARAFDPTAPEGEFVSLQFGADNSWQSSIKVEQKLFDAASIVALDAVSKFEKMQVEIVRGSAHEVATRVRILCYDLLLSTEQVRLTERSLARVQQALEETEAQSAAGMATSYDVLRLQVELANLQPALLRARNAVTSTRRQLAVELDTQAPVRLKQHDALRDTTYLATIVVSADSVDVLAERAQNNRSQVLQLQQMVQLRKAEIRGEQADYLPKVMLFGSWDVQAQQNGGPDFFGDSNSRATSKLAGVSVTVPVFTGRQRGARVAQRQAVHRQAQTELSVARDRAAADVRDLVAALDEAGARERGQRLAMAQADKGFRITMARYKRGVGSRLEMTDAEVALRQSEFNHAQAAHDLLATRAQLDYALGRVPAVDMDVTP